VKTAVETALWLFGFVVISVTIALLIINIALRIVKGGR
jgi:hypothetical protein